MFFNFFGKKEDKGFSQDTLVDIGNGKKAKLGEIIAVNNSLTDKHEIDGSQEITLANGKKITLAEAVQNFIAQNKATDDGEKEDEDKAGKKAEGKEGKDEAVAKAENETKLKNCGCGGKDKHMANCTMYNEDGSEKKDDKKEKMENEIKELKLKNEALEAAVKNMGSFVKIENAKNNATPQDSLLENGTKQSGTLEQRMENSKKFFGVRKS